jgi:hypothetical protein
MSKIKPKCFIAMAFGKEDTDKLYDYLILPTLLKNQIEPVIINRIESNLDLNLQIYNQIQKCDFCIADLTYTRPSVYFEAGYAQRICPVIYTVRSDHLNKNQPDDLRVHFDLQMKNIIQWNDLNDESFIVRLENRLLATVIPILSKQKEEEEFFALSVTERLIEIRKAYITFIREKGYLNWSHIKSHNLDENEPKRIVNGYFDNIFSYKIRHDILIINHLHAVNSIDNNLVALNSPNNLNDNKNISDVIAKAKDYSECIAVNIIKVFLIIPNVSRKRIESLLPTYKPLIGGQIYAILRNDNNYLYKSKPIMERFIFVSGIESITYLQNHLKSIDSYL